MLLRELSGNLKRILGIEQIDFKEYEQVTSTSNEEFWGVSTVPSSNNTYIFTREQIDNVINNDLGDTFFVFEIQSANVFKYVSLPFKFFSPCDFSTTSIQYYKPTIGNYEYRYMRLLGDTAASLEFTVNKYDAVQEALDVHYQTVKKYWYASTPNNAKNVVDITSMIMWCAYDTYSKALKISWTAKVKDARGDISANVLTASAVIQLGHNSAYDFKPYVPQTRGYYNGPIDGGTPAYQFIRGGIDYLRTIDIYDETYTTHGNNAAFLKNKVGELAYNGIEFAYPNIIIRANTALQFTHAVTASWSADNRPVVYEVTAYHEIANNLAEYTLRVDGLKTFFQYHTSYNPVVIRSTNAVNWNKWTQDNVPYDGTYKPAGLLDGTEITYLICMVIGSDIYAMTRSTFNSFCTQLLASTEQEKIVPQISRVFYVPYTSESTGFSAIEYPHLFVGTSFQFNFDYLCSDFGYVYGYISTPSGLHQIEDQSYIYDSNATIHLPCYGDVSAPVQMLTNIATEPSVANYRQCSYRLSFIDGTVAVSVYPYTHWSPTVQLPQTGIPTNSATVSLYNVNRQSQASIFNTITGGISGAAMGFAAGGGVGAVVGAVAGAGVSLLTHESTTNAQRDIINNSQGLSNVSSTGASSMADNKIGLRFNVPNLAMTYPEYYSLVGYPVYKKLSAVTVASGDTIKLAWNRAALSDKKEIIDDLITKSAEGIYWNP